MAMSDDNSNYKARQHHGSMGGTMQENDDLLDQNRGHSDFSNPPGPDYSTGSTFDLQTGVLPQSGDFGQDPSVGIGQSPSSATQPEQVLQPNVTSDYLAAQQQALSNQLAMQGNNTYGRDGGQENYDPMTQSSGSRDQDPLYRHHNQFEERNYLATDEASYRPAGSSEFEGLTQDSPLTQAQSSPFSALSDRSGQYPRPEYEYPQSRETQHSSYQQSEHRPPIGSYGSTDQVAEYLSERQSPASSFDQQAGIYGSETSFGAEGRNFYNSAPGTTSEAYGAHQNSLEPIYGDSSYFEEEQSGDASYFDDDPTLENYQAPAPRRPRKLFIGSIASCLLVIGGGAIFAHTNGMLEWPFEASSSGDTPVIRASSQPVKEKPASPGGKQFANKNKLIYERLQGKNSNSQQTERLVPQQENALETTRRSAGFVVAGGEGQQQNSDLTNLRGTINSTVDEAASSTASISKSSSTSGQTPRKVRTLIVRPDGTVLKPADSGASGLTIASGQNIAARAQTDPIKNSGQQLASKPKTAVSSSQPARKPATNTRTSVDSQTSATLGKKVASISPNKTGPTSKPVAKPAQASVNTKFAVQVASSKSQTDALATFANLQQKYSSILGSYRPLIERVNLGSKGIWYRLRIGPITRKADASQICLKLKNSGLKSGCIIRKI